MRKAQSIVQASVVGLALLASACAGPVDPGPGPDPSTPTAPSPTAPSPTAPSRAAASLTASSCKQTLAGRLASTKGATQVITVEAPTYGSTHATLTLWVRQGPCWAAEDGPWPARIGTKGFSNHHVEGDGTTPTGSYAIGPVIYGTDPDPGVRYPYHRLVCGDWWDEDPSSPGYNTFQHVACGSTPTFAPGSEALWTETNAYPSFAVIEYNTDPVVPGAGSGIFIHANIGIATEGCVSLPLHELDMLLRTLNPADKPRVVMGPASEIQRF